ncbi:MAG TPA: prepilin peptidase [Sphingorhabdus lacus]|jgi:prepilin peptidase CpaA|nr:prepilin peptidase [Sphingorhabdus lacus]
MVNAWQMNGEALTYALVGGLAIALIYSIYTDVRYRLIFNRVTLLIALAAPAYWAATGGFNLPEIGLHLRTATIVFIFFLIAFRFGAMGGGDVKLFAALALWWHWIDVVRMVLYASILGALVTIVFVMIHKAKQQDGKARIPYGVAIALAGLWIAGERIFNHFT